VSEEVGAGKPFGIANLRSAICDSERSEDWGVDNRAK
jgi:hypothetical protein